jgi:hypothetical protein
MVGPSCLKFYGQLGKGFGTFSIFRLFPKVYVVLIHPQKCLRPSPVAHVPYGHYFLAVWSSNFDSVQNAGDAPMAVGHWMGGGVRMQGTCRAGAP